MLKRMILPVLLAVLLGLFLGEAYPATACNNFYQNYGRSWRATCRIWCTETEVCQQETCDANCLTGEWGFANFCVAPEFCADPEISGCWNWICT